MKRRYLTLTFIIFILTFVSAPISTQQGVHDYDPWYDINDDGKIDIKDVAGVAAKFGATGTAINKTQMLLDLQARVEALEAKFPITTGDIADEIVTDLKLAAMAIPFGSTHSNILRTTTTTHPSWDDMYGMSLGITLARQSHIIIIFGCDASLSASGSYVYARALVDSTVTDPTLKVLTGPEENRHSALSCLFYSPNVSAGSYTVKIQWCVANSGYMGSTTYRTLTVIALPV